MHSLNQGMSLEDYIQTQRNLIELEYELEKREKEKTRIEDIDLCFILRSKAPPGSKRTWTTTLPLPKNLIPPEYLIQMDPTYVNVSDKIIVEYEDQKKYIIEGTVKKIRDGELTAVFKLDWEEDSARYQCCVSFAPNDTVFNRKKQALKKLPFLNIYLQQMLCRQYPKRQIMLDIDLDLPNNYKFNDSQKDAIRMAVSNPFSLIQGPPGTGKTHTIGAIAIQALKEDPSKKVLICGTTNVSINSLLEIVGDMVQGEGFEVCWPAASSRDFLSEVDITKEQKLLTLYKSCHMGSEDSLRFKELREKYDLTEREGEEMERLREKLEREIIRRSDVIFSTLDSSGKKSIVDNIGDISTLIVDEATLSVESSMIIPLSLLPDRFVLVGDHKQLGPTSKFDELKKMRYYYSMFERIIHEKSCLKNSVMLNTQYRMDPSISILPNKLFYNEELIDGVHSEDREISKNFPFQNHFNFININGEEEKNGNSYTNPDEITQVSKFVNSLVDSGVKPTQIGVIAAYGAQAHLLSEHFRYFGPRVKVSTIDSFQGSQKDYIVICTSRNGTDIGFLKDERRINVAITRARCLVAIFGNEETLLNSGCEFWRTIIDFSKELGSFYDRLPIKIEKRKVKTLVITRKSNNVVRDIVYEFKENENEAGYNLREIKSDISDDMVRVLWPDEEDDVEFLKEWVNKRIEILDDGYNVTLSYDAEDVCMQFGDIFDKNVDYYNWEQSENDIPEIKTDQSIIISFYQHKGDNELDPTLVEIMKPLFEHQNVTLITFDFTYDFDKLYDFGIELNTRRIIDCQLMILPEQSGLNENEDLICSTGWRSMAEFTQQVMEDNDNSSIIFRAKESIRKGKKKFPHEENHFLISQFNYPHICKFTKLFLEYSANDIFYTAVVGINVLSTGLLDLVKEKSLNKFDKYLMYRQQYNCVQNVRQAYYVRESFSSVTQAQFSKENQTYQILSYYKKLESFVKLLENCPELIKKIIRNFDEKDEITIRERYEIIVEIMKNEENVHLGNIKDKAHLAHVHGIEKVGAYVNRIEVKIDDIHIELEKEDKDNEEISNMKPNYTDITKFKVWENLKINPSKPLVINDLHKFPKTHANPQKKTRKPKLYSKSQSIFVNKRVNRSINEDKKSNDNLTNHKKQVEMSDDAEYTENTSEYNYQEEETQFIDRSEENIKITDQEFPSFSDNQNTLKKQQNQAWSGLKISEQTEPIKEEPKFINKRANRSINENKKSNDHFPNHKKQPYMPKNAKYTKNTSEYNSQEDDERQSKYRSAENINISDQEFPSFSGKQDTPKKQNQAWSGLKISKQTEPIKEEPKFINKRANISINENKESNDNLTNHKKQVEMSDDAEYTENTSEYNYYYEEEEETQFIDQSAENINISIQEFPSFSDNQNITKKQKNQAWSGLKILKQTDSAKEESKSNKNQETKPTKEVCEFSNNEEIESTTEENTFNNSEEVESTTEEISFINNEEVESTTEENTFGNNEETTPTKEEIIFNQNEEENQEDMVNDQQLNIQENDFMATTSVNEDNDTKNQQTNDFMPFTNRYRSNYNWRPRQQNRLFYSSSANNLSTPLVSVLDTETISQHESQENNNTNISNPPNSAWVTFTNNQKAQENNNFNPTPIRSSTENRVNSPQQQEDETDIITQNEIINQQADNLDMSEQSNPIRQSNIRANNFMQYNQANQINMVNQQQQPNFTMSPFIPYIMPNQFNMFNNQQLNYQFNNPMAYNQTNQINMFNPQQQPNFTNIAFMPNQFNMFNNQHLNYQFNNPMAYNQTNQVNMVNDQQSNYQFNISFPNNQPNQTNLVNNMQKSNFTTNHFISYNQANQVNIVNTQQPNFSANAFMPNNQENQVNMDNVQQTNFQSWPFTTVNEERNSNNRQIHDFVPSNIRNASYHNRIPRQQNRSNRSSTNNSSTPLVSVLNDETTSQQESQENNISNNPPNSVWVNFTNNQQRSQENNNTHNFNPTPIHSSQNRDGHK